ncbi:ATP-binding cassette domain-containing protein [Helicobacter himalayensis]|uniref:ATP-binding cassette domain-containing protein n=1 Tax=Helicobacter himalayensis TaxID=1591088 RepID=UPI0009EDBA99|nr:metal ABC transporter ATP-binding protein [Helicobacter himalayensis]
MQLFNIQNLNFAYGRECVLQNVNLEYESKDFLAIIGPNGGGKSTLLKLLLGLIPSKLQSGKIALNCKITEIGYVPQSTQANANFPLRVLEVVLMGRVGKKCFGFYDKEDKKAALEALKSVRLENLSECKISDLSIGQRQRVFIARALCRKCKLLLLDEPTASLDLQNALQIFELLKSLQKRGIGVVVVCHDTNLVLSFAEKIAYINKELFLHKNTQETQKLEFLKHLSTTHKHFCDIEMSLNSCECVSTPNITQDSLSPKVSKTPKNKGRKRNA